MEDRYKEADDREDLEDNSPLPSQTPPAFSASPRQEEEDRAHEPPRDRFHQTGISDAIAMHINAEDDDEEPIQADGGQLHENYKLQMKENGNLATRNPVSSPEQQMHTIEENVTGEN